MDLFSTSFLRSLRNEASRQSDFFATRDGDVSQSWNELETFAHMALAQRKGLRLILCEKEVKNPIIKAGE